MTRVDAWQKEYFPEDFPENMDEDKDGVVYYLRDDLSNEPLKIFDKADYESWKSEYLHGADEIQIDWVELTKENVDKL